MGLSANEAADAAAKEAAFHGILTSERSNEVRACHRRSIVPS
jgi:hypothetical protein